MNTNAIADVRFSTRATDTHERELNRIVFASWFGAAYVYLLILFGAFVRLSGSGLGCGDNWPYCNGSWWPAWDITTWIEWGHRLLGAGAMIPFALVVMSIYAGRTALGSRASFFTRCAKWIIGLLVIQALLGALTVKLDLSAPVTAIHFVIANVIMALFITVALRAHVRSTRPLTLPIRMSAALALFTVGWGALTANSGASLACLGFPLCNGQILPMGPTPHATALLHTHWAHRLLAYALTVLIIANAARAFRSGATSRVKATAGAALVLLITQVAIGAGLIELMLPVPLRGLHVAVGVALFASLLVWSLVESEVRA
jgi:heme A synthase